MVGNSNLEYWTTLVLADSTFGWKTGQLQAQAVAFDRNTGQLSQNKLYSNPMCNRK